MPIKILVSLAHEISQGEAVMREKAVGVWVSPTFEGPGFIFASPTFDGFG
jgi:hypothetical protein